MTHQAPGDGPAPDLEVFSQVSAVRARTAGTFPPAADAGTFDAEISDEWTIVGKANGGYLLALMGRAALSLAGAGHVVAASAHYLRSPGTGPVEIEGELLRRGRTVTQVRTRIAQDGRLCAEALMSISELDPCTASGLNAGLPATEPVPFEDCPRLPSTTTDGFKVAIMDQVDLRLDPDWSGVIRGLPSGRGELRGWLKLPRDEDFDPVSLLYAVDAFPPVTFDLQPSAWASTIELTVYVRALPAPGPVRIVTRAGLLESPWVDGTCHVWDTTGRLVAQATQLNKVLA